MLDILYMVPAGFVGYLLGAIPFGLLYVKFFKGVDVRKVGSGRTGGTNSFRAAGLSAGILTAISDVLKGAVALIIVTLLLGRVLNDAWLPWAQAIAGIAAVIGHNWSIFINFAGGAGTGPNVGWAAALWWPAALISIIVVGGGLRFIGVASIASILMALVIPITFGARYLLGVDGSIAYTVGGLATLTIVLWALRPNIIRLIKGEERIVGPRSRKKRNVNGER